MKVTSTIKLPKTLRRSIPFPKLYGLLVARNESDVIRDCLMHALGHCDKIIAMDSMSDDATWQIITDMADQYPQQIIAHARLETPFNEGLRAIGYNAFHHELSGADWWLRLDADEFLNADPAGVLALANHERVDFVRANQMNFELTDLDAAAIESGADLWRRPIWQRRLYYRVNQREFRMFRNNPDCKWDRMADSRFPQTLSEKLVCSRDVFNRRYATRDIEPVKKRLAPRIRPEEFQHLQDKDWKRRLTKWSKCHRYDPGGSVHFRPFRDFWLHRIGAEIQRQVRNCLDFKRFWPLDSPKSGRAA